MVKKQSKQESIDWFSDAHSSKQRRKYPQIIVVATEGYDCP